MRLLWRRLDYLGGDSNGAPLSRLPWQLEEMSPLQIREDGLTSKEIAHLLRDYLENMIEITPPESVHALDLEELRSPDVTFWSAWEGDELLGCGALKKLDSRSGEVKSVCTAEAHLGRSVASRILEQIIQEAERRGYDFLSLETGTMPEFAPARAFYLRHGFEHCGPFAKYSDDPNSAFMTKTL